MATKGAVAKGGATKGAVAKGGAQKVDVNKEDAKKGRDEDVDKMKNMSIKDPQSEGSSSKTQAGEKGACKGGAKKRDGKDRKRKGSNSSSSSSSSSNSSNSSNSGDKGTNPIKKQTFNDREIEEFIEWFDYFKKSKENSNMLDKQGFKKALTAIGWDNITDAESERIFDEVDVDKNGFVDREEYMKMLLSCRKDPQEIKLELMEAFRHFDRDRSGYIDKFELRRVFFALGLDVDRTTTERLFNRADSTGDGRLYIEDFVKLMMERPDMR